MRPASASSLTLPEAVPLAHALLDRVAQAAGVRVLFIKGPAAVEQGLRSPRTSADVDALVDPAGLEQLRARLTELGWVDDHPYSTPTAAGYSRTHHHPSWPCELDLHVTFPGVYADPQAVFEHLWLRRDAVDVAGQEIPCPDVQAHTLLLALNSLREPHSIAKSGALEDLAERVATTFDPEALGGIGRLARTLGASDTSAPFLRMVGAPNEGLGSTAEADLQEWRLRTQPAWRVATWMRGLRQEPIRSRPRYLWRAVVISEAELRSVHPELPPGRRALLRSRWRRLRRGVATAPAAWRSLRAVGQDPAPAQQPAPDGVVTETRWRSARVPAFLVSFAGLALGLLDSAILTKRGVLVRTAPDFDDQGLELSSALSRAGIGPLVWLVKGREPMPAHVRARMPAEVRLVDARSLGGVWQFLRARVVVHTHGLYGIPPRGPRKLFVNLWHGWGTKELADRPLVAARQSDIVTVCSVSGQQAVARAWGVDPSVVVVTGLPRNDAMLRAAARPRPEALRALVADDVPLVLWLPTYRRSVVGEIRVDGTPFDNDFQLPHCPRGAVEALAGDLGVHIIVKTHPMSEVCEPGMSAGLTVWEHQDLDRAGVSLYELMGHADVLVTDYSSAWVDYLLLDRPIVFTLADVEEYAATRGHDSALASPEGRPGPVVHDVASLGPALDQALTQDTWSAARRAVCADRHQWTDADSARRVVDVIVERLTGR